MKKLLLGLLVLIGFGASAQITPGQQIYKLPRLQVTRMPLGAMGDSVVVRNEVTGELKFARRNPYHLQQQKYSSVFSLVDMSDSSFITKKHLLDAIGEIQSGGSAVYFGGLMTNQGTDNANPTNPDTLNWIATKTDVLRDTLIHTGDSIQVWRNGEHLYSVADNGDSGGGVDSITKVADSFRVWDAGVYKALKDSIAPGTAGITEVNRGPLLKGDGNATPLDADTSAGKLATQFMIKTVAVIAGTGISVQEITDANGNKTYQVINSGSPGSNPMNALDLRTFGAQSDWNGSGTAGIPTGTDNTPFLQSAINAAASGQWIIVPAGAGGSGYAFKTALDTITGGTTSQNKRVYLLFLADIALGKNDFIRISNQAGAYEQHRIVFKGNLLGRTNEPAQNYTNYIAGTGPNWANYTTGVAVKLINVNQCYVEFNKVTSTRAPIELISFGGAGCQENTIVGSLFNANKYGILFSSPDGNAYTDKNSFSGPGGGRTLRIGGQYPLYMDGYAGAAPNGESYNAHYSSDEFHFLIENADELPVGNADISEPEFDITVEQGTTKGVLNPNAKWAMRTALPNNVRSPKYNGGGFIEVQRLGTGSAGSLGVNGTITLPIWTQASTSYLGNYAQIDGNGTIWIHCPPGVSQTVRNAQPAYVKFINLPTASDVFSTTSSTYSVASTIGTVKMNNASGTVTLPSPSGFPTREITIFNLHANDLTVSGTLGTGVVNTVNGNSGQIYWSDGAAWYAKGDGGDGGGGADSTFTADAQGRATTFKLGIRTPSVAGAAFAFPASTTSVASFVLQNGVMPTTPISGAVWRVDNHLYFNHNSTTREILTAPDNGSSLQVLGRNTANDDVEWRTIGLAKVYANGSATLDITYNFITINGSSNLGVNLSIPSASGNSGKFLIITNPTAYTFVMGGTTYAAGDVLILSCNGTTWTVNDTK